MITISTLQFILTGSFLGLTAGISPGPLLTLVITQTIKHNKTEGIKIAICPLITDLPIILITLLFFYKFSHFNTLLSIISFIGGTFVAYLGYESVKFKGADLVKPDTKSDSMKKGIMANFLSPYPYLFWVTIGMPYVFKAYEINLATVIIFFVSFYAFMTGSKIAIAMIVARSKIFTGQKIYIIIMKLLGIALFVFSLLFLYDGIKYLRLN